MLEKKNNIMLMTALQAKSPDVFAEYQRLKEAEATANAPQQQQQQGGRFQQQQQFQPSQPVNRNPGGRF
jgi:hypothetical protein